MIKGKVFPVVKTILTHSHFASLKNSEANISFRASMPKPMFESVKTVIHTLEMKRDLRRA